MDAQAFEQKLALLFHANLCIITHNIIMSSSRQQDWFCARRDAPSVIELPVTGFCAPACLSTANKREIRKPVKGSMQAALEMPVPLRQARNGAEQPAFGPHLVYSSDTGGACRAAPLVLCISQRKDRTMHEMNNPSAD